MAITYPLTFPSTKTPASIVIRPISIVGVGRSIFTGETQVQAHQGQLWAGEVTLPTMKRANAEEYIAFFLKLNGPEGTFLLGDPSGQTPRGSALVESTGVLVNGGSQTGNALNVDGFQAGESGVLLPGDYIQLGSGATTRLHRVLNQVDADSAGAASIDIWPQLRSSPADNAAVTISNTKGLFQLAELVEFPIDAALFYELSFTCVEAL